MKAHTRLLAPLDPTLPSDVADRTPLTAPIRPRTGRLHRPPYLRCL